MGSAKKLVEYWRWRYRDSKTGRVCRTLFQLTEAEAQALPQAERIPGSMLLRESGRVLLEAAPEGMDPQEIGEALARHPGVVEVHDLHVWEVTSGFTALAVHIVVPPDDDCHERRRELKALLAERFEIQHTTIQVDHAAAPQLLEIQGRAE